MKVFLTFLLLVSFSLFPSTPSLAAGNTLDEYLPNGSFELGPKSTDLNGTVIQGKYSLPKWEINGHVEYRHGGIQPEGNNYDVKLGDYGVRLGNNASISQNLTVKPGSFYAITLRAIWTCTRHDEIIRVSVSHQSGDLPLEDPFYTVFNGDTFAWGFKATSMFVKLTFYNPVMEEEDSTCGPLVDAVNIKELTPPCPTGVNLVKNGGFEEGPLVFNTSDGVHIAPQNLTSALPGWIIDTPKAVRFIDSKHFSVASGLFAVELVSGTKSTISQIIRTIPQKIYTLTFAVGDAKNYCDGILTVEARAANATLKEPFMSTGMGTFKTVRMKFRTISLRTTITFYSSYIRIRADNMFTPCGPVVDKVVVLSSRSK